MNGFASFPFPGVCHIHLHNDALPNLEGVRFQSWLGILKLRVAQAESERELRSGRDVAGIDFTESPVIVVAQRHLTHMARESLAQTSARVVISAEYVSDSISAFAARIPGLEHRIAVFEHLGKTERSAVEKHGNHLPAHPLVFAQKFYLGLFQFQFSGADALADNAFRLTYADNGHRSVRVQAENSGKGLSDRYRFLIPSLAGPCAKIILPFIGKRTVERDARTFGKRQEAVRVLKQDHRSASGLTGKLPYLRGKHFPALALRIAVPERIVEEPHLEFGLEAVVGRPAYLPKAHLALVVEAAQMAHEMLGCHIHVYPRIEGAQSRSLFIFHRSLLVGVPHGLPVGHQQALEAQFVAKHIAEQVAAEGHRQTIVGKVGLHHAAHARLNAGPVRRKVDFLELTM